MTYKIQVIHQSAVIIEQYSFSELDKILKTLFFFLALEFLLLIRNELDAVPTFGRCLTRLPVIFQKKNLRICNSNFNFRKDDSHKI